MEKLEKEWNVHPVFHVDFNGANFTKEGVLETMLEDYVNKWEKQYGLHTNRELETGLRFRDVLKSAHEQTATELWYSSTSMTSRYWMCWIWTMNWRTVTGTY